MKQWKNNLDERQEQALEKIEGKGCWLAFWGLLIALMVQVIAFGPDIGAAGRGMDRIHDPVDLSGGSLPEERHLGSAFSAERQDKLVGIPGGGVGRGPFHACDGIDSLPREALGCGCCRLPRCGGFLCSMLRVAVPDGGGVQAAAAGHGSRAGGVSGRIENTHLFCKRR